VLINDERVAVQRALAAALASRPDPQSLITAIFLNEADSILLDIRAGATPPEIAAFTMNACLRSRWSRNPSLLEQLLEYLVEHLLNVGFRGLLDRVRRREDPNPSPYDAAWLLDHSRPFFDRHELRGHMPQLIEGNGRPILRVTADEKSFGRSYTGKFFEHLEDSPGTGVHVATAEISRDAGPSYRIGDMLDDLSMQFPKHEPTPDRSVSSYPLAVARWLLWQMIRNDGLWLVVLDGFGQRPLNDEVRETVEALAYLVTVGQRRRRVRLVLLDYPHPLPNVSPADVLEETLAPAANVCQADLMPCLVAWDVLRKESGLAEVPSGELDKLARELIGEVPAEGRARLEMLNTRLSGLLRMP
jgi:hypothetical protein